MSTVRLTANPMTPRARFRLRPLTWVGLTTAVVGSAPLLGVILAAKIGWMDDPNPNPVGLGILAACTFWPGIAMTVAGLAWSGADALRNRRKTD